MKELGVHTPGAAFVWAFVLCPIYDHLMRTGIFYLTVHKMFIELAKF